MSPLHPRYLWIPPLILLSAAHLTACGGGPSGITPTPETPTEETPTAAPITPTPTGLTHTPTPTPSATPGTPTPTPLTPTPTAGTPTPCVGAGCPSLIITELMPRNDGAWVDEAGHADDWIEIRNIGEDAIALVDYAISDRGDDPQPLPDVLLAPGETLLLWADGEPEQGPGHLDFKLSGDGETLYLFDSQENIVQEVPFPDLPEDVAWARLKGAFTACAFPTPGRPNLDVCALAPVETLPEDLTFAPYTWRDPFPAPAPELRIVEADLRGTGQIELLNVGSFALEMSYLRLEVAGIAPGQSFPGSHGGVRVPLPSGALAPGARIVATAPPSALSGLEASGDFEGVVSIFDPGGVALDRLDFSAWPEGAALTRWPEAGGLFVYCVETTLGAPNTACDPLQSRPASSWLRHLRTPGDFEAFGAGDPKVGVSAVKVIVDLNHNNQVYFLDSDLWDLHYTFVREVIEGEEHLDRCDPVEAQEFNAGWGAFSQVNYYNVSGRSYLLGTLSVHGTNDLRALEFSTGDVIIAEQMRQAFFETAARVWDPPSWSVRAQDDRQTQELLYIDGTLPAVTQDAPYAGMVYQPLNEGVAYGTLTYVPTQDLGDTPLGPQVIVVTDQVPLDIPLVGGLITEAFQTPLSHVAVLSRNRGTPNMAAPDAHLDPRIATHLGQLVKLTVDSDTYRVSLADLADAEAYWDSLTGSEGAAVPSLDRETRGFLSVEDLRVGDTATVGAKAALLGELRVIAQAIKTTSAAFDTPEGAFGIPVSYYLDHMASSGAGAALTAYLAEDLFHSDALYRRDALAALRGMILAAPVDPTFLGDLEGEIALRFGDARVRLRSSSNAEDIDGFTGAGLYTSVSAELGDPDLEVGDGIRAVWASLWGERAFDERTYFGIDHSQVAMGVLCHLAYQRERANGVAVSRNIYDARRGSTYFYNVQFGEASVVGPVPGVVADELLYRRGITPPESYLAHSSFLGGEPVLSAAEGAHLSDALKQIGDRARLVLDPDFENPYFAMDIEFKLLGDERRLLIKQARPYSFGRGVEGPCD